jgi:membrane-associated phospholipid phosphatase
VFQTDPILFLQGFASAPLTTLMEGVSAMGYTPFYVTFLCFITLGVSFRKGFLIMQLVLWTSFLTDILKNGFALPRPSDVDSAVKHLGEGVPNTTPFHGRGATAFLGGIDAEVLDVFRAQPEWSFGLPSGHVSGTTALWGGMSLLFRRTIVFALAAVIIVLMPLSRMYLGRHFLADVLGGLVVGGGMVALAYFAFIRPDSRWNYLLLARLTFSRTPGTWTLLALLVLAPMALLLAAPVVEPDDPGRLLGLNLGFILVAVHGFPDDRAVVWKRAVRFLLSILLFGLATVVVSLIVGALGQVGESPAIEFAAAIPPTFLCLWGTVAICLRTGLYPCRL